MTTTTTTAMFITIFSHKNDAATSSVFKSVLRKASSHQAGFSQWDAQPFCQGGLLLAYSTKAPKRPKTKKNFTKMFFLLTFAFLLVTSFLLVLVFFSSSTLFSLFSCFFAAILILSSYICLLLHIGLEHAIYSYCCHCIVVSGDTVYIHSVQEKHETSFYF